MGRLFRAKHASEVQHFPCAHVLYLDIRPFIRAWPLFPAFPFIAFSRSQPNANKTAGLSVCSQDKVCSWNICMTPPVGLSAFETHTRDYAFLHVSRIWNTYHAETSRGNGRLVCSLGPRLAGYRFRPATLSDISRLSYRTASVAYWRRALNDTIDFRHKAPNTLARTKTQN